MFLLMYTSEDTMNNNAYFANAGIHPRIGLEGVGVVQMVIGVAPALLPPKKEMVPDLPFFHFLPFIHFFIFTMCFFLAKSGFTRSCGFSSDMLAFQR